MQALLAIGTSVHWFVERCSVFALWHWQLIRTVTIAKRALSKLLVEAVVAVAHEALLAVVFEGTLDLRLAEHDLRFQVRLRALLLNTLQETLSLVLLLRVEALRGAVTLIRVRLILMEGLHEVYALLCVAQQFLRVKCAVGILVDLRSTTL